jgi:hypothetical protein
MAQIVLKDASISIGGVELADRSNSVEVNYEIESVEVTAFGGNRSFVGGLQNNTCTVELMQDFAATETEATIFPLVGTQLTLIFKPTSEAVARKSFLHDYRRISRQPHTNRSSRWRTGNDFADLHWWNAGQSNLINK